MKTSQHTISTALTTQTSLTTFAEHLKQGITVLKTNTEPPTIQLSILCAIIQTCYYLNVLNSQVKFTDCPQVYMYSAINYCGYALVQCGVQDENVYKTLHTLSLQVENLSAITNDRVPVATSLAGLIHDTLLPIMEGVLTELYPHLSAFQTKHRLAQIYTQSRALSTLLIS